MAHNILADQGENSLSISLLVARSLVMQKLEPILAKYAISDLQWRVLSVLISGATNSGELAKQVGASSKELSKTINLLRNLGYVAVIKHAEDRRRTKLTMTIEGHAFIHEMKQDIDTVYADIADIVGADQLQKLISNIDNFCLKLHKANTA